MLSYLFILCTEALIANIRKAKKEKQILGLRIARASQSTTHLLFTDDSLFFCKANTDECQAILNILNQYERVSGQQINFTKSSIQFGHTVDDSVRTEMQQLLGISTLGGIGSYLGIPESLGGAKTKISILYRKNYKLGLTGGHRDSYPRAGRKCSLNQWHRLSPRMFCRASYYPRPPPKSLRARWHNFGGILTGFKEGCIG